MTSSCYRLLSSCDLPSRPRQKEDGHPPDYTRAPPREVLLHTVPSAETFRVGQLTRMLYSLPSMMTLAVSHSLPSPLR